MLARFLPPVVVRKFELDELGAFVVGQINGKKTVLELVDAFVDQYKISRREAELSVVAFLKSLIQRRIVSVTIE